MPATEGCIENSLVLHAIVARAGEGAATFHGSRECIEHAAVGVTVRKNFLGQDFASRMMHKSDRAIDREAALDCQHAMFADHLYERTVLRAKADMDAGQHAEAELQRHGRAFFELVLGWRRLHLAAASERADGEDLLLQEKSQRVDSVNANVADGAAACHAAVLDPGAGTIAAEKAEVRGGEDGSPDSTFGDQRPHSLEREV